MICSKCNNECLARASIENGQVDTHNAVSNCCGALIIDMSTKARRLPDFTSDAMIKKQNEKTLRDTFLQQARREQLNYMESYKVRLEKLVYIILSYHL